MPEGIAKDRKDHCRRLATCTKNQWVKRGLTTNPDTASLAVIIESRADSQPIVT